MPLPTTINDLSKTAGSNFPQGTDSPSGLDDTQRAHASFIAQLRDGDHVAAATAKTTPVDADLLPINDSAASNILKKVTWANLKATLKTYFDTLYAAAGAFAATGANTDITSLGNNTSTIYTTAGTSTAYTITPSPAITAYAVGQSFVVNFNAASGASPTLQISGIATPPNLVRSVGDGTYSNITANAIPANHRSRVTLISTTQALIEEMPAPFSMVRLNTINGFGSTNTKIRRFLNTVTNQGADITYADSATLGASFTINTAGVYGISYSDQFTLSDQYGVSLNSASLTTSFNAIPVSEQVCLTTNAGSAAGCAAVTVYLPAGSVLRPHTAGTGPGLTAALFTITRVS
jgi:hypothetical protein